jgi:predicted O-methyltransferase YrrM
MYGQYPPLVNVCLAPGLWQTYDIVFRDARFDKEGKLLRPAVITVFHNGVLVQDHVELTGPTAHKQRPPYQPHPERMPLRLQDHNYPVRFRNIWVRELGESQ